MRFQQRRRPNFENVRRPVRFPQCFGQRRFKKRFVPPLFRLIFASSPQILLFFSSAIKEYSNWPTIPQVFVNGEFVGGCDIMLQLHQTGKLVDEFEKAGVKLSRPTAENTEGKS